jgi:rhomboid protease GluP
MPSHAIICNQCKKLISKDEGKCPFCGTSAKTPTKAIPNIGLLNNPAQTILLFVGFSVLMYIGSLLLDTRAAFSMQNGLLGLGAPSTKAMYTLGLTGGKAWECGHVWTLLTATFLHGSLIHIFFNMSWLRSIGLLTAHFLGPSRFVNIYILTGLTGFLASNLWANAPTIGASCALFGLMGVLIAFGKRRGGEMGKNINRQAWTWTIAGLCIGFAIPQVNNMGHIGGLIGGYLLGYLLPAQEGVKEHPFEKILAIGLICLTLLGFALSFWRMQSVFTLGIVTC